MKWLLRLLLVLILLGGGVIAYLAITFRYPELVGVSSVDISAPEDSVISVVIDAQVYNPNLFGIPVESLTGTMLVSAAQVGTFDADTSFTLTAGDTSLARIRIVVSASSLANHYERWMATDSSLVEVDGNAHINMMIQSRDVPLEFMSMIPLKAILTEQINEQLERAQQISAVEVVSLARDSSSLTAVMRMTNPYPFPIKLVRTDCSVLIGGVEVGHISTREPIEIEANGVKTIEQRIELSNARSVLGLGAILLAGSDVEVRGTSTVMMLGYEFVIPIEQKPRLVR